MSLPLDHNLFFGLCGAAAMLINLGILVGRIPGAASLLAFGLAGAPITARLADGLPLFVGNDSAVLMWTTLVAALLLALIELTHPAAKTAHR